MDILLAVLTGATLLGLAQPQWVRSRPHLLAAVGGLALSILFLAIGTVLPLRPFLFISILLDGAVLVLLVCAVTGSRWLDLAREIGNALRLL